MLLIALTSLSWGKKVSAQAFAIPKGAPVIDEVPEIFHGTWRITGSFHSYKFVAPEDFIGKTITINANGYQLGEAVCEPEIIREYELLNYWYYDYSKNHGTIEGLSVPNHLRKNYTKVTSYSLKCPPPKDDFFSLATHHIVLRHYEPSDGFIVFLTVAGPEFILESMEE